MRKRVGITPIPKKLNNGSNFFQRMVLAKPPCKRGVAQLPLQFNTTFESSQLFDNGVVELGHRDAVHYEVVVQAMQKIDEMEEKRLALAKQMADIS